VHAGILILLHVAQAMRGQGTAAGAGGQEADVKSKPLSAFGNKTEQMTEMKSRCSAMSKELKNVTCTVPRRKNGRLTCHNPAAKAKKAEGIYIVGMGKY